MHETRTLQTALIQHLLRHPIFRSRNRMPPIAFNFYRRQNPICWMKIAYWRNQKSPFESCKLDFPALRFAVLPHNTMKGILYRLQTDLRQCCLGWDLLSLAELGFSFNNDPSITFYIINTCTTGCRWLDHCDQEVFVILKNMARMYHKGALGVGLEWYQLHLKNLLG